jgi:hypothetical protein
MSNVRIVFPKHRLAEQLKTPGGPPAAEALKAAAANLAQLAPECLEELEALVAQAEACLARFPATFQEEPLRELYAMASRGVGMGKVAGAAAADVALISLCDVLDYLIATAAWDLNPVTVHVRALRLLVGAGGKALDANSAEVVMAGLQKVSARYAQRIGAG